MLPMPVPDKCNVAKTDAAAKFMLPTSVPDKCKRLPGPSCIVVTLAWPAFVRL
ncbi:hypothetical protein V5799_029126, partial [Amblyomma americanum]